MKTTLSRDWQGGLIKAGNVPLDMKNIECGQYSGSPPSMAEIIAYRNLFL